MLAEGFDRGGSRPCEPAHRDQPSLGSGTTSEALYFIPASLEAYHWALHEKQAAATEGKALIGRVACRPQVELTVSSASFLPKKRSIQTAITASPVTFVAVPKLSWAR